MLLGDVAADGLDHEYGHWFASADDPRRASCSARCRAPTQFQFGAPLPSGTLEPSLGTLQALVDALRRRGAAARPHLEHGLAAQRAPGRAVPGRPGVPRRRRRARAPADRRPGPQHRRAGRLQPRLEARRTARRSCSTPTRPSGARSRQALGLTRIMKRYADGDADAHERGENTRQLGLTYRTAEGRLAAGDRAPDAPLGTPTASRSGCSTCSAARTRPAGVRCTRSRRAPHLRGPSPRPVFARRIRHRRRTPSPPTALRTALQYTFAPTATSASCLFGQLLVQMRMAARWSAAW